MKHETGDETADFLLQQLNLLARLGSPAQKKAVPRWRTLVRENAKADQPPMAASFATEREENKEGDQ